MAIDKDQPSAAARVKPRRPWEVFVPAKRGHPPNPLRYSSVVPLAVALVFFAAFATWVVFPARETNSEMHAVVAEAKAGGIPQVPPPYASDEELQKFITEWQISCAGAINGTPTCDYLAQLAHRSGEYRDDISMLFVGVVGGLLVVLFLTAIAFSRALNNLYALGYEASEIPAAWAFISFFIPLLNFVLPWVLVDQVWRAAWSNSTTGDGQAQGKSRLSVVAAAWGLMTVITVVFNPVTMSWFVRRSDIDGWLTQLEMVNLALAWVVVPVIFTTVLLVTVSWRQRRRFQQLDAAARAQGQAHRA